MIRPRLRQRLHVKPIRGFSQLHVSGPGWGQYAQMLLSPQVGLAVGESDGIELFLRFCAGLIVGAHPAFFRDDLQFFDQLFSF